jgi:phosphosulfolactate synthase
MSLTIPMTTLALPQRTSKPRRRGLTMVIDTGLPTRQLDSILDSHADLVDVVKLGWGTCLVTSDLDRKLDMLRSHGVDFYFGGTLFEKFVLQQRFDGFRELLRAHGCRYVEVSNGTLPMTSEQKAVYIRELSSEFTVYAEVGFKDPARSAALSPEEWVRQVQADLAAGAQTVILEARESGRSGIGGTDGKPQTAVIDELVSEVDASRLLFEAPTRELQTYLIEQLGANVNLGNIPADGIVNLETMRLGLRADTFYSAL